MKMKLIVLKKLIDHSGKKIDNSKMTWEDWRKKLLDESEELIEALHSKNKKDIMEETLDIIQICIGIIAKLFKEGIIIEQGIYRHNKKLCERGCEASAVIRFNVNKR